MEEESLEKYFSTNSEERLSSGELDAELIQETQKILDSIDLLKKMEAVDSRIALEKVKSQIGSEKSRKWMTILQRVAAVLVLPLLAFVIWQASQISDFNQSIVQNSITTPPTLRSVFTLPDGTQVWLNGNTTITYPTFFAGKERLIELNGEAYFKVAHNKKQPFVVKTGKMLVQAVGTEFNCLAFGDNNRQETLLTEGKVNILLESGKGREQVASLSPNEMAVFDSEQLKISVQKVDPEKYVAWKNGQIIFKNDALNDVLQRLERWYNVEFIRDTKLKSDYAFTGSFDGEELTQILNYIELTTPINFEVLKIQKDTGEMYQKTKIKIKNK